MEIANFIHGRKVEAADGQTTDVVDPSTGEAYARAALSREADVDAAFRDCARAFEGWRETTPSERQRALLRIADAFEERAGELVEIESQNTGKPKQLTLEEEIPPMCDQIRFFAGAARVLEGKSAGEYMQGYTSYVRREPVGVCAAVTPWNYPMMMAVWKWAPAIAAGNTMVLKPSDTTPVTTVRMSAPLRPRVPPRSMPRGGFLDLRQNMFDETPGPWCRRRARAGVPARPAASAGGARRQSAGANASIIASTSSPRGYRIGHVQPESMYSVTFARHSSAVPAAASICTMSSGTSLAAARTCSAPAGQVSVRPISSSSSAGTA
jgi:hypothetical protein